MQIESAPKAACEHEAGRGMEPRRGQGSASIAKSRSSGTNNWLTEAGSRARLENCEIVKTGLEAKCRMRF